MANLITEEGLDYLAGVMFKAETQPTTFVAQLVRTSGATPTKTSQYADLTFLSSGDGYSATTVTLSNTVLSTFQTDDVKATFEEVEWTATGTWEEVDHFALTKGTVLIAVMELPSAIVFAAGAAITITPQITAVAA